MMRKGNWLLAMVLAGLGCVSPGTRVEEESRKTPPVQLTEAPPQVPPTVTADQVTDTNALEMAQALGRELDFAANERATASPLTPAKETVTKP